MSQIKVSVIIPVYNTETNIHQCLDSVLNQALQDIEVICVDDGSTDNSPAILDEYALKDNRVKILHQQNQYAGIARNHGMEIAQGEYLYFLDSDDFIDSTLLEKTYTQAKAVDDADVVLFGGKKYDETKDKYIETPYFFQRDLLPNQLTFSRTDLNGSLLRLTTPCPWTKLFRRSFVEKQRLRFQALRNSNDVFFVFVSLSLARVITYVDKDLVYYRVGQSNNLQSQKNEYSTCFADAYEAVYHELIKRGVYPEVEKGFVDQALSGCAYNLKTAKSNEARMRICERLNTPSFKEMGLLDYPDEYYSNLEDMKKVRGTGKAIEWREKLTSSPNSDFRVLVDSREANIIPEVSVIIPVYNTAPWLEPCLDSILNQSLQNIEVICIDDGSTDNSREILLRYAAKDNRIVVFSQNNSGLSAVRNRGVKQAHGKYIYFMDSDDLLNENALEKLTQRANQDELEILCFNGETFADVPELESQVSSFDYYRNFSYVDTPATSGCDLFIQMRQNKEYKCSVCLFLIQRTFLLSSGIRFYNGVIHEDEMYTYELLLSAKRVGCFAEIFFRRRLREGSVMTKKPTFSDTYGYFISSLEMIKFADQLGLQGLIAELVWQRPKELLRTSRRFYAKLSVDESETLWGLPLEQQLLFQSLIVDYCDQQSKANHQRSASKKTQTELKNQKSENTKLEKQLADVKNSHSYKLGNALLWPVRVYRGIRRQLRKLIGIL